MGTPRWKTIEEFCGSEFWNDSLTLETDDPQFTECFQQTALVWIPSGFLFLFTALQFYILYTSKALPLPWACLNVAKLTINFLLVLDILILLLYIVASWHSGSSIAYAVDFVWPLILCLSLLDLLLLSFLCKMKGVVTSGVIFLSWLLFAVFGIPEFKSKIRLLQNLENASQDEIVFCGIFLVYYAGVLVEVLLNSFADKRSAYIDVGKENACPEHSSSFLSQLVFEWFTSLAIVGWKRPIEKSDLWALNDSDSSRDLVPRWEAYWVPAVQRYQRKKDAEVERHKVEWKSKEEEVKIIGSGGSSGSKSGPKLPAAPSIVWRIALCFKGLFLPAMLYKLIADLMQFASPQLLKYLIRFIEDPSQPTWFGYMYAVGIVLSSLVYSLLLHQYFHNMFILGMNLRTVLVSSIFTKSLRLSNAARRKSTVGEIVNLMSVDAQRFMDVAPFINMLWSCPLQIALCLYFLWMILGPSVLAGVAVMVLLVPVNGFIAAKSRKLQMSQMKFKDDRIKLMNEILNGMKVLKLYAWEIPFEEQVLRIRDQELNVLKKAAYLSGFGSFTWICAPFLVAVATFATFVLASPDNVLTPEVAFVSLALLNILRFPMSMLPMMITFIVQVSLFSLSVFVLSGNELTPEVAFVSLALYEMLRLPMSLLPMLIVVYTQASVSNKRLKDFLTADELDPHTVSHEPNSTSPVTIANGTFAWDREADTPTLQGVNLTVGKGSLVAVVGQVGSGKSSLLSAILGEMDKIDGRVNVTGSLSYVPQQAWIQNATLRDNITFARAYDEANYENVLDACALKPDLEILPAGDQTEIGEKGINLSGGQKQRVSLARAVYQASDIYLLDDPLSAVDSHVGKHIFEKVIGSEGLLKNSTRILVTHGLSYLKYTDQIVVITEGKVSEIGTYAELIKRGGAFAQFLETYLTAERQESEVLDEETSSEINEILGDLDKIDPDRHRRLVTQLSTHSQEQESYRKAVESNGSLMEDKSSREASPTKRQPSVLSTSPSAKSKEKEKTPPTPTKPKAGVQIIETERAETGKVKFGVYLMYLQAVGYISSLAYIALFVTSNAFSIGGNVWLADWSANRNITSAIEVDVRLGVYAALGFGQGLFVFFGSILMAYACVIASAKLHRNMLRNLLRSALSFYDVTPLGRIVNRLGKDVDIVDNTIPQTFRSWVLCVVAVFATLVVIVISTPIFAVVILPLALLYYFVQRFYVATSRQLKRLESTSRSPIYSHFQEAVAGAASIRAYGVEKRFLLTSESRVDENQRTYYPNITSNRWLAIRLEFVGNSIAFFAAIFAVISRGQINSGLVGLSVSYALSITQALNWAVRMTSELETNIVAVERIKEYTETPTEAEWEIEGKKPAATWPAEGKVQFADLAVRYRPDLDLVLKGISCDIAGGEKIGIVGRTGAGKSSLTLCLFRIIEAAKGSVRIDGLEIGKLGLHDLRSKLTIIPQDPVLFSGILRQNLDPFGRHSDAELWAALEHSHLKNFVAGLPDKLEHKITEGGENLSVGQRQLVCLARALLRKTKVLILDEATAAVDLETDDLIQKTIRQEFRDCTILTIAHRLNTIMDSTRVMVLDQGKIAELDAPAQLLANRNSIFYSMARDAGLV